MTATTTVQRKASRDHIICHGCGEAVKEIDPDSIGRLLVFDRHEEGMPRAFECTRCEAIIFETEFLHGKFVPPQFRAHNHTSGHS